MPLATLSPDARVDLQMHTIRSDGAWTPPQLLDYLADQGFAAVAITDHDRVDVAGELAALGAARGVHVIPAVEVTTRWDDRPVDLLCFGFDATRGTLDQATRVIRETQIAINQEVYAQLERQGYTFPRRGEVLAEESIPHPSAIVRLLLLHEYAADQKAAVDLMRAAGHKSAAMPLDAAIAAVHADGGVAIIAHPGRREAEFTTFDLAMFDELRAANLAIDGIEVYYPLHSPAQVREFHDYAATYGWLVSAGSDSHGPHHRLPIAYHARQVAALLDRCQLTVTPE